jgi:probable F420-dependent oxidoreductase
MRAYLDAMAAAPYGAPEPAEPPLTILAALGPRMLALSASHADGAHPYNVTPEHTHEARGILGPGKLLCPEVWVLLETDAAKARALGRQALANYMRLDNYLNNWRRLGFGDADFAGGGSDRFIDENVAWGDEARSAPGCSSIGTPAPTISASSRSPGRLAQARRQGALAARAGKLVDPSRASRNG